MEFIILIIFHVFYNSDCSSMSGFNLYHTDHLINGLDGDCLYYRGPNDDRVYQVIEYCTRYQLDQTIMQSNNHHSRFTFEDLCKLNITSYQLYKWLAPVDLTEKYQNYLENKSVSMNMSVFYNCTDPWFGSRCEYRFDQPKFSLTEQIETILDGKLKTVGGDRLQKLSCYTHLQCDRTGSQDQTSNACLDWREICDGKVDCINGGYDEEQCWQLEINECDNKTEFRCHIGLCIPLSFLNDDEDNPDCLDQSDEPNTGIKTAWLTFFLSMELCIVDPAFRCEEHMCRPTSKNEYLVDAGDGTCMPLFQSHPINRRNHVLINASITGANVSEKCYRAVGCLTGIIPAIDKSNEECIANLFSLYVNDVKQH